MWRGSRATGSGYFRFQIDELATYPSAPEIEDTYLCFTFHLSHVFSKATTQARPNTPSMTISAMFQFPENLPLPLVVVVVVMMVVVVRVVSTVLAIVVNMFVIL